MPDVEGETPDFEDLNLPEGEPTAAEPAAEVTPPTDTDAEPLVPEGPTDAAEQAAAEELEEKEEAEAEKAAAKKQPKEQVARLLASLAQASPYTVMLGIALVVLVIALFCLLMELGRYGFDTKASSAKQKAFLRPAAQSGPASTIAAA